MRTIYLDHAATTPMREEARAAMEPFLGPRFGNPSSLHRWGREARNTLEEARERVASSLGCQRDEIVFTAGGTEANNLAVLGAWRAVAGTDRNAFLVCSSIEHKAVLGAAARAAAEGARLVLLGVDRAGRVDPAAVDEALPFRPAVVSIMWGNNEVGTLQPVAELATRCAEGGISFHSDAVQALGKDRVRLDEVPVALLSASAHKLGGPRGVGALFVRRGTAIEPLHYGGGQEAGLSPGTENVAGVIGFATALELAVREQESECVRLVALRDELTTAALTVPGVRLLAAGAERLPHVVNLAVSGVELDALLFSLDLEGVAASSGSACQSGATEPSHVLVALGEADPEEASLRLSLGRQTTGEDVRAAAERLRAVIVRLRENT